MACKNVQLAKFRYFRIHLVYLAKKEDAFKYREVLYKRELTTAEKEKLIYSQTKRSLDEWENCIQFFILNLFSCTSGDQVRARFNKKSKV